MPAIKSISGVTATQIRAARDRILASDGFVRSGRQRAFLDYVIDAALDGRESELKEFTLGIEVFNKDGTFDPGVDSIVRVEASRLRSKLIAYYADEGRMDPVRIDIPKGHYVPKFHHAEVPEVGRAPSPRWQLWMGVAVTALTVLLLYSYVLLPVRGSNPAATSVPATPSSTVAVLPLRDWSPLPEEYFAGAMTDALISSLAKIRPLQVTSFTSVMKYENTDVASSEIGRELDVAYVVEGSVRRDGERIRISTQLIDTQRDVQLWADTFDTTTPDLLSVEREISAAIAAQIIVEIVPAPQSNPSQVNPAAHEAYMKGRYFYNQFTADGYRRGMEFFQEAIDIEPDYAAAYAGLASCHCLLAGHGLELVSPIIAIPQARAHAIKALNLDGSLAEPFAFLGIIDFKYGWKPEEAEAQLERAIALNPSLYQAYVWHSQVLEAQGRHEEAVSRARKANQLNPLSLAANLNLAWQMYQAGNYIEAAAEIDSLIDFDPDFWGAYWVRGHIFRRHQMYDKAIDAFQKAVELEGGHSLPLSALGYSFAVAGRTDEARQVIKDLEVLAKNYYVSPFHVATIYAGLNESDRVFDWLERAYLVRARSLAWLQVTSELQPYQDDPRFQDLLHRIGIVQTNQRY